MNYRKIYELHHGEIKPGNHIHHIDGDRNNNNIDNLISVSRSMHYEFHKDRWENLGLHKDAKAMNALSKDSKISGFKNSKDHNSKIGDANRGWCSNKKRKVLASHNEKRSIPLLFNRIKYNSIREAERLTGISRYLIKKNARLVK